MNISRPVASSLEGVGFGPLVAEDIRKLSVKRVVTPNTYDTLLNPIPGGLYDPALGATTNRPCSTCHLDELFCPGHCGHIELPVWNYHCIFMDQVFRLLRAQCVYCHRLRLSRVQINRYVCQLRLLQHGLIQEAKDVIEITQKADSEDAGKDNDNSDEEDGGDVIARQNAFVKKQITKWAKSSSKKDILADEAVQTARRELVASFKADMVAIKKCAFCKAVSPGFRKNRFSGIFVKPLNKKEKDSNERNGISQPVNSLVTLNRAREAKKRRELKRQEKRARREEADEGVADLESSSNEEADYAQDLDMLHELIPDGVNDNEDTAHQSKDDSTNTGVLDMQSAAAADGPDDNRNESESNQERYLPANEAHASLSRLFDLESDIMGLIYLSSASPTDTSPLPPSADMFFIHCLLVPPSKYRKEARMGGDVSTEPPEHSIYKSILNASQLVWQIMKEVQGESQRTGLRLRNFDDLQRAFVALQDSVNSLIDNTKSPIRGRAALRLPEGIKQKLEKKEGLFRMFIMGKRVNFAARTVLSPDPNLETNEIGIPPVFARTLTYPEPVTAHNFDELKLAVQNGPNKWPGASAIEYENGQVISLKKKTDEERLALSNLLLAPSNSTMTGIRNKKVHRHLNNGDIVIMNRQPTLHKPSMMCHRAKVLPQERTFRMHYANCKTYNADFDGDEMNMHFPQNEVARAEALQIADTDHQYLSATAGEPLRGLIQDHISMSVWLTCADMFFNREEYQELLYCCIRPEDNHTSSDRILLVDPAILKPKPMWTGKQIITTILKNIKPPSHAPLFMESPSSTPREMWVEPSEEGVVRIEDGELLTGILDKKQIGPAARGIIHTVYEAYGHVAAGKLMSILGRLLTRMLNMRAFSCGVEDLILTNQGDAVRKEQIKDGDSIGLNVAAKYVSMENKAVNDDDAELRIRLEGVLRDDKKQADLDVLMNSSTSQLTTNLTKACLPNALIKLFPKNQMQAMTTSGAKGSLVNANQISCNLGQQVLEGRRVPTMISGKTLPSFKALDTSIRSGGYIVDRFLTGVRPQEYYFHAMAGREGLIDTAVKTSRSGYLQRCLVKGLEGLRADYDSTVRDSDGTIIQALYGEDGLETSRKALMDFSFQAKNFLSLFASLNVRSDDGRMTNTDAIEWNSKAMKRVNKTGNIAAMDPVLARYPPASAGGSVSEAFHSALKTYIKENPDGRIKTKSPENQGIVPRKTFESMLRINYLKSLVPAGEAVGVVAAQSLGEPSTQMTLNTFHLAGHAAKNVTLGIPRLRDILMTARQSIPLPIMKLNPIAEMTKEDCDTFARSISRLSLAELIETASVEEIIGDEKRPDVRIYKVRLQLYPSEEYTQEHAIQILDVADKLEQSFVPLLALYIKKEMSKRNNAAKSDSLPEIGKSSGRIEEQAARPEAENEGGDSDEEDGGEDDATNAKRKANLDEGLTFEDPDEDEQEVVRQGEDDAEPPEASDHEDEGYGGSESSSGSDGEGGGKSATGKSSRKAIKESEKAREARVKENSLSVGSFVFSEKRGDVCEVTFHFNCSDPKILLLDLVKRAADNTVIHEIPGVKSCTTSIEKDLKAKTEKFVILAAGVNLRAMHTYQEIVNPHTIYTNDIYQVLIHYGVEAARNLIILELRDVFQGHSISVDHRHLMLVADYMTRNGGFQSFSRTGMRDKRSAFAKMSFETTMGFLSDAVMQGDNEDLTSPSARITLGKIGKMGSGMCDVFLPT